MSRRRAFTLIEMLLATVLATVLMVGVLAVVTDLGASGMASEKRAGAAVDKSVGLAGGSAQAAKTGLDAEALEAWIRLLREDIGQAFRTEPPQDSRFSLTGYGALDARSRERTPRPVTVLYAIEEVGGRLWLVRRQAALDVMTDQNIQRDLVCGGIVRFQVVREGDEQGGGRAGAVAWRLLAWVADQPEPACDRLITVRAGGIA
jgi:prepilin-type N-terminal cleavage/methylation domain-containing protein